MPAKPQPEDDASLSTLSSRALLLRAMQRDPDGETYWKIVSLLHKRGDRATFEAAIALCQSPIGIARQLGATVVAQLGKESGSPHPYAEEATPILLEVAKREEQPEVLRECFGSAP